MYWETKKFTCLIAIFALLQWCGTEPAVSEVCLQSPNWSVVGLVVFHSFSIGYTISKVISNPLPQPLQRQSTTPRSVLNFPVSHTNTINLEFCLSEHFKLQVSSLHLAPAHLSDLILKKHHSHTILLVEPQLVSLYLTAFAFESAVLLSKMVCFYDYPTS